MLVHLDFIFIQLYHILLLKSIVVVEFYNVILMPKIIYRKIRALLIVRILYCLVLPIKLVKSNDYVTVVCLFYN